MIAGKFFMTYVLWFFHPMALATAYGQRPKFFRAEHSATAKGENCAYGLTLLECVKSYALSFGQLNPDLSSVRIQCNCIS